MKIGLLTSLVQQSMSLSSATGALAPVAEFSLFSTPVTILIVGMEISMFAMKMEIVIVKTSIV
jgi:hypothetical protein